MEQITALGHRFTFFEQSRLVNILEDLGVSEVIQVSREHEILDFSGSGGDLSLTFPALICDPDLPSF